MGTGNTQSSSTTDHPLYSQVAAALATVEDPEIHRPLPDLGMIKSVTISAQNQVEVVVLLTIAGCPMKSTLTQLVTDAVSKVSGVTGVNVILDVMDEEQRAELKRTLRGGRADREIPFAQPQSLTRVYAISSGKGGVGKSSVTVNLAVAMAQQGLKVGVLDADVYGFSIPRMLGATEKPTRVDDMIIPPQAHGVSVISIGMFVPDNQPVAWRGPMLHRALTQFLADVYWGNLDYLLLDLPPGTGDVAISIAQLVPNAEVVVVTTPQTAAAEVAERAGVVTLQTRQHVAGVIENMAGLMLPDGSVLDVFGSGGGEKVAATLSKATGASVPVLGSVPLDPRVREGGDAGAPIVVGDPESPAAQVLSAIARDLTSKSRGLAGKPLGITPVKR